MSQDPAAAAITSSSSKDLRGDLLALAKKNLEDATTITTSAPMNLSTYRLKDVLELVSLAVRMEEEADDQKKKKEEEDAVPCSQPAGNVHCLLTASAHWLLGIKLGDGHEWDRCDEAHAHLYQVWKTLLVNGRAIDLEVSDGYHHEGPLKASQVLNEIGHLYHQQDRWLEGDQAFETCARMDLLTLYHEEAGAGGGGWHLRQSEEYLFAHVKVKRAYHSNSTVIDVMISNCDEKEEEESTDKFLDTLQSSVYPEFLGDSLYNMGSYERAYTAYQDALDILHKQVLSSEAFIMDNWSSVMLYRKCALAQLGMIDPMLCPLIYGLDRISAAKYDDTVHQQFSCPQVSECISRGDELLLQGTHDSRNLFQAISQYRHASVHHSIYQLVHQNCSVMLEQAQSMAQQMMISTAATTSTTTATSGSTTVATQVGPISVSPQDSPCGSAPELVVPESSPSSSYEPPKEIEWTVVATDV